MHPHTRLRARKSELDDGYAFLPDFRQGFVLVSDDEVEAFAEEFIAAATSAEAVGELARDEIANDGFLVVETPS